MIEKKSFIYGLTMIVSLLLLLAACSDDENNSGNANGNMNDSNIQEEENDNESSNENEDENQLDEENNDGKDRGDRVGENEWADDDMGLSMGDTGLIDSNLGKAEITLDSVEKVDGDKVEEDVDIRQIIAVHLTVKNIGDESFDPENVIYSGELHEVGKDYGAKWKYFEGVSEEWQDTLEPDEDTSGIIVFNRAVKDELKLIFGDKLPGTSNKTSFEFSKDEMD